MASAPLAPISIDSIRAAARHLEGLALRTPLLRSELGGDGLELWLKCENLQPIGSFKIRGAGHALALASDQELARGVFTASAGNMAQGLAWVARARGVPCTVVAPDHAPKSKLEAIARLGARTILVPFDDWWQVLVHRRFEGEEGLFIHPVSDAAVIAGNGTIGLEILEDLPDVDAVVIPYGGGGLLAGIASAMRAERPGVRIFAAEVETAAPLSAALARGEPTAVPYAASFVDGIGSRGILEEMWTLVRGLLDGAISVSLEQVAASILALAAREHLVTEGAGAAAVAAALTGKAGGGKVVCILSGGNIDPSKLACILGGAVP